MKISMFGLFIKRPTFYQNVVRGFILLFVVMLDQLKNRVR